MTVPKGLGVRVADGFRCTCTRCGGDFTARYSTAAHCSQSCRTTTWIREHPERALEISRAGSRRYLDNPVNRARGRAANAEYKRRERERCSERERLRKAQLGPQRERIVPLIVLETHDGVCGICGEDVDPFGFEVDHVLALARGGSHSYENTQPAHPTCNRRKYAN